MAEEKLVDFETIKAAVAGEEWAVQKVIEHFSDYIDSQCTVSVKQPDGSTRTEIDEDMRQRLILKLIEAIPHFPIEGE